MLKLRSLLIASFLAAIVLPIRGQDEEKIQKLFQSAIEAMGGDAYLNVKDMVSEGNYFMFNMEGDSSGLIKFNEYTKLPDKDRFELGNKKKARDITVFNLEKNEGWILEYPKDVRAATADEMKDFKNEVKHNLDNIFRFHWKNPSNKLFYMGPGEGTDVTLEMVKLLDPENDEVTIYFDRISKLPAKIEYRGVSKRGVQERHVDEFSQWHMIGGINTPLRVDGYVNRKTRFQAFITKISYNSNIPDSLFMKPEPSK